ncbi:MAG: BTAD domain-containing putative transcriptional regulator [bacterium]
MIRLRTLGVVEVAHDRDGVLEALVAQPKRLALLVYLAVAKPTGYHRRDRLVALFWPELDDERARAALRRSLHFLRSTLGADAVLSRGDELAIDPKVVTSDLAALETAITEGRLADAVDLYHGDFLSALHVKGSPELEQWMDSTRDTLRGVIAAACWSLAERSAKTSPTESAGWSARACTLAPYDEGALRRRLQMLHAAGDNAAALRAYTDFAEWLHGEFGAAPAEATRAVAEACRVAPLAGETRPSPAAPRVAQGPLAAPATDPTGPAMGAPPPAPIAPPPRNHRRLMSVAAAVVVIATSLVALSARTPSAAGSAATPVADRIVVIPFSIEGAGPFGYLRYGLVDLLSGTLDGSGPMRAVDPHAVFAYTTGLGADSIGASLGPRVAVKFGARYYVSGSVLQSGGRVNVTATIFETNGTQVASTHASGDESMLFAMVDTLTRQLLMQRFGDPGARLLRVAFATTASLPALKAYITGMHELRLGRFDEATTQFTTAVSIDSAFALAHFGRSVAIAWSTAGRDHEAVVAARHAVDLSARLPVHDQELVRAHWEQWAGKERSAESRLRRVLDSYPSDLDAWHELAEVRFHQPGSIGAPFVNARAAFVHALDAPALAPSARVHLARIAAYEGDSASTRRFAQLESGADDGDTRAEEIRLLDAAVRSDDAAAQPIISALARSDAPRIWTDAWSVAQYAGNWRMAERIARLLTGSDRSDEARTAGWLAVAHFRQAAGRPLATDAAIRSLATLSPVHALVTQAGFAALPHIGAANQVEVDHAISSLRAWTQRAPDALSYQALTGNALSMRPLVLQRLEKSRTLAVRASRTRDETTPYVEGPIQAIFPVNAALQMDAALAAITERRWSEADRMLGMVFQPDRFDVALIARAARARLTTATALGDRALAAKLRERLAWLERDAELVPAVKPHTIVEAAGAGAP